MAQTGQADRPERVVWDKPETQNLLGLLIKELLETNLSDEAVARRLRAVRAEVELQAGDMVVTLRLEGDHITIVSGAAARPRARVQGDMKSLAQLVTGGSLVWPVLRRKVRVSGDPFLLLRLLPLVRRTGD